LRPPLHASAATPKAIICSGKPDSLISINLIEPQKPASRSGVADGVLKRITQRKQILRTSFWARAILRLPVAIVHVRHARVASYTNTSGYNGRPL